MEFKEWLHETRQQNPEKYLSDIKFANPDNKELHIHIDNAISFVKENGFILKEHETKIKHMLCK
jgi:hypothetical protein